MVKAKVLKGIVDYKGQGEEVELNESDATRLVEIGVVEIVSKPVQPKSQKQPKTKE